MQTNFGKLSAKAKKHIEQLLREEGYSTFRWNSKEVKAEGFKRVQAFVSFEINDSETKARICKISEVLNPNLTKYNGNLLHAQNA